MNNANSWRIGTIRREGGGGCYVVDVVDDDSIVAMFSEETLEAAKSNARLFIATTKMFDLLNQVMHEVVDADTRPDLARRWWDLVAQIDNTYPYGLYGVAQDE